MTIEEKQLVMYIARDIYVENLRRAKDRPEGENSFAKVVKAVNEGFKSLPPFIGGQETGDANE